MNTTLLMTVAQVMKRGVAMLVSPGRTWDVIAEEPGGMKEVFYPYAVLMGLIPLIMFGIVGAGAIAALSTFGAPGAHFSGLRLFASACGGYAAGLVMMGLMGGFLALLAALFGARKSWVLACRVVIYAGTPFYVSALFGIIPLFGWLFSFLAIPWSLVLLYQGIGRVLRVQGARQLLLTLSLLVGSGVISGVPMYAYGAHHVPQANVVPLAALPSALDPLRANARVMIGQASDDDIQEAADYQLQQMVQTGQMKPSEAAAQRAGMIQELQRLNVEAKKTH